MPYAVVTQHDRASSRMQLVLALGAAAAAAQSSLLPAQLEATGDGQDWRSADHDEFEDAFHQQAGRLFSGAAVRHASATRS